jgi:hypothetical protein
LNSAPALRARKANDTKRVSLMVTARRATLAEAAAVVAHLRTDPNAAWVVSHVERGALVVWWDQVVGRDAIGALNICLENLGSGSGERRASRVTGRRWFRVSEARSAWRESTGDEAKYALLEQYIADAQAGRLRNRTVTLLDDANGVRIIDGDKRAIAIYETSAGQDSLALSIFILRPRPI